MSNKMSVSAILSCLVLAAALVMGGLSGEAKAFKRKTSVTGSQGRSASQEVNANRTGTGYARSSTTTGPRGKSTSSQSSGSWDKSTNTWNKNKSVTGPNGQTESWEKSTTITK